MPPLTHPPALSCPVPQFTVRYDDLKKIVLQTDANIRADLDPASQEKKIRAKITNMVDNTDTVLKRADEKKNAALQSINSRVKAFIAANDGKEGQTLADKPAAAVHVVVDKTKQADLVTKLKEANLNDLYTSEDVSEGLCCGVAGRGRWDEGGSGRTPGWERRRGGGSEGGQGAPPAKHSHPSRPPPHPCAGEGQAGQHGGRADHQD